MSIQKSIWGELTDHYFGNVSEYVLGSPYLNDPANAGKPLYIDAPSGKILTVTEYKSLIARLAYILHNEMGIGKGEVVLLMTPNDVNMAAIHMATLSLGAVLSPSSIAYNATELAHQFHLVHPKVVICGVGGPLKTANEARKVHRTRVIGLPELLAAADAAPPCDLHYVPVDGKTHPAMYCMSSGTSGIPKGVIITHRNMASNLAQNQATKLAFCSTPDLVGAAIVPMSHILGLHIYVYQALWLAQTTVVLPRFDLDAMLKAVCKYQINVLYLVPPIILRLGKLGHRLDTEYPDFARNMRYIMSAAAPLSKTTIGLLAAHAPKLEIIQIYGLTETSPFTHFGGGPNYNQETVGWLLPSMEARIVDPVTGNDTKDRGELWLRGPNIFLGYINDEAATKSSFAPGGWFTTGDICVLHPSGEYQIVDRIKELIKSKGNQVAPAEIEGLLLRHDDVLDAAVIGVWEDEDHRTTELPRAYLVLREGSDPLAILRWLNSQVARHKRLWGGCVVVPSIPKSPAGKILRRLLRDNASKDSVVGLELAKL